MTKPETSIDFASVRKIVESGVPGDTAIRSVDRLLSAVLILSPVVLGPVAAIPLLALFDMKSDLIGHVRDIARRLAGRQGDFLDRSRSLAAAHLLITYSAYFEAANTLIGTRISDPATREAARRFLVECDGGETAIRPPEDRAEPVPEDPGLPPYAGLPPVSLPHPASSFTSEADDRRDHYRQLNVVFRLALRAAGVETAEPDFWDALPDLAVQYYQAQYLELMLEYQDFFGYAMLYEQQKTQEITIAVAGEVSAKVELARDALNGIDHGLSRLSAAIAGLAEGERPAGHARKVAKLLHHTHRDEAGKPVFAARPSTGAGPQPVFPSRAEAFIPQACQVIVNRGDDLRLEHEPTWERAEVRDDLGGFLVHYLTSGYSAESPLVLLGHPGSGKSLLTRVLAAGLLPPAFTTVRIELRHIDPSDDLQKQIEKQIRKDTGYDVNWAEFAEQLHDEPPLIILDGYDELLQATGQVHANYLRTVHAFQERERRNDRPVRVIITSRITLIDKAYVPLDATVLRLLEFDESRRERWAEIWNAANQRYFIESGVHTFVVPDSAKLLPLAKQPLLLLMLALYDSAANELASEQIDQTLLYYNLLVRFVRRELEKDEERPVAGEKAIADEMRRLSVVAIGMFNREAVSAQRPDIDADLAFFKAERPTGDVAGGAPLSQADLLLGSFFFVHESQGRTGDRDDAEQGRSSAFEFLHNTFGEFLAAEFIVAALLANAGLVARLDGDDLLAETLDAHFADPKPHWFATFAFTALHTRPVIVEMIREWLPHRAEQAKTSLAAVEEATRRVVDRQLLDVTTARPPAWFTDQINDAPYAYRSLLGHLATYTLNLTMIGAVTQPDGYLLPLWGGWRLLQRPWTSLTHLWRSWFPPENLLGLAAIVEQAREGRRVGLRSRAQFGTPTSRSPVETASVVARLLSDGLAEGNSALTLADFHGVAPGEIDGIESAFEGAGIHQQRYFAARRIKAGSSAELPRPEVVDLAANRIELPMAGGQLHLWEVLEAGGLSEATVDALPLIEVDDFTNWRDLPTYQARRVIAVKAGIEPRWLTHMLRTLSFPELTGSFAVAPAAAEVLRAARKQSRQLVVEHADALLRAASSSTTAEVAVELVLCDFDAPWRDDADRLLSRTLITYEPLRHLPRETATALLLTMAEGRAPESAARMPDLLRAHIGDGKHLITVSLPLLLGIMIFLDGEAGRYETVLERFPGTRNDTAAFLALLRVARLKADPVLLGRYFVEGGLIRMKGEAIDHVPVKRLRSLFGVGTMAGLEDRLTVRQMADLAWLIEQNPDDPDRPGFLGS